MALYSVGGRGRDIPNTIYSMYLFSSSSEYTYPPKGPPFLAVSGDSSLMTNPGELRLKVFYQVKTSRVPPQTHEDLL